MSVSSLFRFLTACALCLFATGAHAKELPTTYLSLAQYIEDHTLTDSLLNAIDRHLPNMNPDHSDSLKTVVFPRIIEQGEGLSLSRKCLMYEILATATFQLLGDFSLTEKYGQMEIEIRQQLGNADSLAVSLSRLMFLQSVQKKKKASLATALRVRSLLEDMESKFLKSFIYRQLCVFYESMNEYRRGLEVCREGEAYMLKEDVPRFLNGIYESQALFHEKDNLDKAISYRRKALKAALSQADSFNLRTIYRNIARNYADLGQADSAQQYFTLTFELYENHPDVYNWYLDQVSYGHFLLGENRIEEAQKVVDTLEVAHITLDQSREHAIEFMALKEYMAVVKGDVTAYLKWSKEQATELSEYYSKEKAKSLEKLSVEYDMEKKEIENSFLRKSNSRKRYLVFALIGLFLATISAFLLLVKQRKQEKKISSQRQELLAANLSNAEQEKNILTERNHGLKEDIRNYIKQFYEQETINQELLELVEELRVESESPIVRKKTSQMKTRLKPQVSKALFKEILRKAEELYPHLLEYVKEKIGPDKEFEILCAMMYFLGYETKYIAPTIGKTEKAIRGMRYRIRKKLEMSDNDDFVEFMTNLQQRLAAENS